MNDIRTSCSFHVHIPLRTPESLVGHFDVSMTAQLGIRRPKAAVPTSHEEALRIEELWIELVSMKISINLTQLPHKHWHEIVKIRSEIRLYSGSRRGRVDV